jgi:putative acyl-CoA dehydrogenase
VRANTTVAKPVDQARTGSGAAFSLTGHKWFTSAPMSDGFLTLSNTLDEKVAA